MVYLLVSELIVVQGCGVLDLYERPTPDREKNQQMNGEGSAVIFSSFVYIFL